MAKINKKFDFKNAEVNLDERVIYEFGKNDEGVETHSLDSVLQELANIGRGDISIVTSTTLAPLED